ncbi:MAG: chemotaxis response regulator protein-glutamate methylesterase [candidate division Zixibacteria bacterium]|nr:chemotaxis response regulator protein-glutamate methylesterase [candidate division Zixibacteria bacterium]
MTVKLQQIRILVVDDSAFMRKAISMMLESDPAIKVVGTARDGEEGIQKVRHLKPDLVTMDIEMPRMDGLTALREIMAKHPVPVMMISSLTTDGARATLDALEMGAVDFIPKELSYVSLDIVKIREELVAKIKNIVKRKSLLMARFRGTRSAGRMKTSPGRSGVPRKSVSVVKTIRKRNHQVGIIAIGSSTGGPPALAEVIPRLPRNLPAGIVIAQHMPPKFTKSLAERLNGLSELHVKEAADGDPVEAGTVLIAPGGQQMTVNKAGAKAYVRVSSEPSDTLYKPCVDVMLDSVAASYHRAILGVILTGMGSNGVTGLRKVKSGGGVIIAQDEPTCIVYGMPRAAAEAGVCDHIVPIEQVAQEIVSYF